MEIRLLGTVEIVLVDQIAEVGPPQRRLVLAILAAEAGRPVSTDRLVDRVWDDAPDGARRTLQVHISRIRRLLATPPAPMRVVRRSGGYLLDIDSDRVDVHRFQRLVSQARHRDCLEEERPALLGAALELWRGAPLSDLPGRWAARFRQGWQQRYLETVVAWALAHLRAGDSGAVLPRLAELVGEHPLVEPLATVYMRALYAAGRTADALEHYRAVRHHLAEELGIDPGAELQQLHRQILAADPALSTPAAVAAPEPQPVPRQLPAPPHMFTGRTRELAALDRVIDASTVVISAIDGMAGVGKTALAVHWAHRVADRFADGQLYLNLRGFDPAGPPVEPPTAVRRFLDALQVPPQRIPPDLESQVGLYRSLLAHRRMLIVLDNARTAEQVRPLLPGTPGTLVLVTSRHQLIGLVAAEGAIPLGLDPLPEHEARQLLMARLGHQRLAAEPEAVADLLAACAGLPLALAVVAAQAVTRSGFSLAALTTEVRDLEAGLEPWTGPDSMTDLRAVFSWSYHALEPDAARLFRLLGLHPGPDLTPPAAASLAGIPLASARRLLTQLADAHLLIELTSGRYTLHDLLRAYATELVWALDSEAVRRDARHRLLDYYLDTADLAVWSLFPDREPVGSGVSPERPSADQALSWLRTERAGLVAAVAAAVRAGLDTHAWKLAWVLYPFLDTQGFWQDATDTLRQGLAAALRVASLRDQAGMHWYLGRSLGRQRRVDAEHHLRGALEIFTKLEDHAKRVNIHLILGSVCKDRDQYRESLHHSRQALALAERAAYPVGRARALQAVCWDLAQLGDLDQAIIYGRRALAAQQEIDDPAGVANTWDSLGFVHHRAGEHERAIACYRRALADHDRGGDRCGRAETLGRLGDAYRATGSAESAATVWRQALAIFQELGDPNADEIRRKLEGIV